MTRLLLLCIVLLLAVSGGAHAVSPVELPVEGATAVWVQPIDATPGSLGAALSLTLPERIVGETVSQYITLDIVIHPEGGQVRIDPGLAVALESDVGVPVKVGVVYLPLTDYKVGWFVGAEIYRGSF